MSIDLSEPLLTPDDKRFVMFPIKDQNVFKMYKDAVASFWTVEEVDLSKDYADWEEKKLGDVADFYKGKGLPKSDIVIDGKYKCLH